MKDEKKPGMEIYLNSLDVWDFYKHNTDRLQKEIVTIAENHNTDISIAITASSIGLPVILVYKGENKEYEEMVVSHSDSLETLREVYERFFFAHDPGECREDLYEQQIIKDYAIPDEEDEYIESLEKSRQEMEDSIYEREDELWMAFNDFIDVVLCDAEELCGEDRTALFGELFESTLDLIADSGFRIYRPTIVEEIGGEIYMEYPYEE